ncbi:MAG: YicC family protein [Planctomycetes bacterium]|nr:YicC family protein [Planctomycetota bacterium]
MSQHLRSMTGFGSAQASSARHRVQVEVRSVNHRYLKVIAHLGESLGQLQHRIDEQVRERFGRGSFAVTVKFEPVGGAEELIDHDRVRALHRELIAVHQELTGTGELPELSVTDLLHVEGGIRSTAGPVDVDDVGEPTEAALLEALDALESMQRREGDHLRSELRGILGALQERLDRIEAALPDLAVENRDRYRARLAEFLAGTGVDVSESDVLREVAILAEKADITEEVGRLRGHFDQYREAIEAGGRVGRKLDFITQEMFREANTMVAKVNRYDVAREVVEVKADIDRLREQTQNIE